MYNICSAEPALCPNLLNYLSPKLPSDTNNWLVLFRKVKVMLLNKQPDPELIEKFQ